MSIRKISPTPTHPAQPSPASSSALKIQLALIGSSISCEASKHTPFHVRYGSLLQVSCQLAWSALHDDRVLSQTILASTIRFVLSLPVGARQSSSANWRARREDNPASWSASSAR
eukprot:scaffold70433_cov27-Tisochrysis_lutea.AAC.4